MNITSLILIFVFLYSPATSSVFGKPTSMQLRSVLTGNAAQSLQVAVDVSNEETISVFLLDQSDRSRSQQEKFDSIQNDFTYFWTNFSQPFSLEFRLLVRTNVFAPRNTSNETGRFAYLTADSNQTDRLFSLVFFPEPGSRTYSTCIVTDAVNMSGTYLDELPKEMFDDASDVGKVVCPLPVAWNNSSLKHNLLLRGLKDLDGLLIEKTVYITLKPPLADLPALILKQKLSDLEDKYNKLIKSPMNEANKTSSDLIFESKLSISEEKYDKLLKLINKANKPSSIRTYDSLLNRIKQTQIELNNLGKPLPWRPTPIPIQRLSAQQSGISSLRLTSSTLSKHLQYSS